VDTVNPVLRALYWFVAGGLLGFGAIAALGLAWGLIATVMRQISHQQ